MHLDSSPKVETSTLVSVRHPLPTRQWAPPTRQWPLPTRQWAPHTQCQVDSPPWRYQPTQVSSCPGVLCSGHKQPTTHMQVTEQTDFRHLPRQFPFMVLDSTTLSTACNSQCSHTDGHHTFSNYPGL